MKAEPAYNMVLNNFCFNGDLADLGEYVDGPGTPDFAVAYLLHFMARLLRDFKARGLLSEEEAKSPQLLAAYLSGASRLPLDNNKYCSLNASFPQPEVFELGQERFRETGDNGYSGAEMANYHIKITDAELSLLLSKVKTDNVLSKPGLSAAQPQDALAGFKEGYRLFKLWDENVLRVLGYPLAAAPLTQQAMRGWFEHTWQDSPKLSG